MVVQVARIVNVTVGLETVIAKAFEVASCWSGEIRDK